MSSPTERTPSSAARTLFVSRHPGAKDWLRQQGVRVDRSVDHLEIDEIRPGDTVIGTLPIGLVARVCELGARYLHLAVELPRDRRGVELGADDLRALGACLIEYRARTAAAGEP